MTTQSITQAFDQADVSLENRDLVSAMAAGRKVAYAATLPTDQVNDPVAFFNDHCLPVVEESLGAMNEGIVLNIDFAIACARLYWVSRYRVLHEPYSTEANEAVSKIVEKLIAGGHVSDLGLQQDPQGGSGSVVVHDEDGRHLESVTDTNGENTTDEEVEHDSYAHDIDEGDPEVYTGESLMHSLEVMMPVFDQQWSNESFVSMFKAIPQKLRQKYRNTREMKAFSDYLDSKEIDYPTNQDDFDELLEQFENSRDDVNVKKFKTFRKQVEAK